MTTKTKLITARDPKGLHAVGLFETAYNKTGLDTDQAQRLNENGGVFQDELMELIRKHSATNQFADEVVSSNYIYPSEYQGPKPITEQIQKVAEMFGLDGSKALAFAENLPALPAGAEGWFAIPKVSVIASKHFAAITDAKEQYCEALKLIHKKIADARSFHNYRDGQITPSRLRVHARTLHMQSELEASQEGDIIIIAAQLGMRHRGKSVRRARETFVGNEFGLTSVAIGTICLVHPERLVRYDELDMDCAGDEFDVPDSGDRFGRAPDFGFVGGRVGFGTIWFGYANGDCGSASAFVPQDA